MRIHYFSNQQAYQNCKSKALHFQEQLEKQIFSPIPL